MTIASEIQRIQTNIANAYTSLEAKGATMPDTKNSANLASTIDSVPLTGDNTVQAFALGDAKNAVEGDKVTLNFSAGIFPIEESVAVSSSTDYFFTGYAKNTEAVFLSGSYAYVFKKNPDGVWSKTSTTSFGSRGVNKQCSPFGLLIDSYAGTGFKVTNGYLTSLDYGIAGRSYEPRDRALFSTTGEYCAVFSNAGSGYKTVVYYKNSLLQVLDEWSGASYDSVPRFFFANKDGVEYLFVGNTGSLVRVQTPHTYRLTPTGAEYLGRFSVSRQNGDYVNIYATASVGDLLITSSNDDYTTLSSIGMFKTEVDPTQKTVVLKDASKEFTSFRSVVNFPTEDGLNLVPTGDVNIIQYRGGCVKYNPSEGTFEPYLPTGVMSDRVFYNADERVAVKIIDNTTRFNLYRLLQPIEQPYVAASFADRSYYFSSGLTGIVKENNNGILKVSTVEDPNNPPPAVPDEAGLKTTITYGSPTMKANYTVVGTPTISGTTVTDFAKSSYVQSNVTVGSSSGTIEYYTAFTVRDLSAIGNNTWTTIIDTIPGSVQKGVTLWIASDVKTLNLSARYSSSTYVDAEGSSALVEGTKYFAKAVYDGSTWKTYLSTSGHDGYNPFMPEGETTCSFYPTQQTLTVGRDTIFNGGYNSGSSIEVDLAETKVVVNGVVQWVGAERDFGSVSVGYGYFRNVLTNPSDKYISYNGGLLTEDNVFGEKATEMNVVLGRSANEGSWTSTTKGFITTQDEVVEGVNKKLSTPIYLWHDLSYITPAIPETIEPDVTNGYGYEVNADIVGTLAGTSENNSSCLVSGFSSSNYVTHPYDALRKPGNYFYVYIGFSFMIGGVEQYLLGSSDGKGPVTIRVNSSNQLVADIFTTDSTTPTYTLTGTTTLTTGPQTYKLRLTYGTGGYVLSLSTDGGSTYTQEAKNTSTTKPYEGSTATMWFGYSSGGSAWQNEISFGEILITCGMAAYNRWEGAKMGGSIGLPVCWANLKSCVRSGQHLMTPSDTVVLYDYPEGLPKKSIGELKGSNYLNGVDLNDMGAISIDTDGIATGFDGSSQLTSGGNATVVDQPQDSFDLYFSFLFTGTVAETDSTTTLCDMGYNAIKIAESSGNYYLRAYVRTVSTEGGYIPGNLEFGQEGTSDEYVTYIPFTYQLSPNTRYWVKLSFTKDSGYSMWASTDGVSYSKLGETADLRLPEEMIYMSCGYQLNSTMGVSAYLDDWYINVDGKEKAWSALGTTNNLYVVKGSSNEFSLALAGGRAYFYNGSYGATYSAFLGTVELYPEGGIKSFTPGE